MADVYMSAAEWFELKALCGTIYKRIKSEQPIDDYMHYGVLQYLKLDRQTVCDYCLYGSQQFKLITTSITMLYNDSQEIDKRQVFVYDTPSRHKHYIPK